MTKKRARADKKTFICRCEDVTLDEVNKAIDEGFTTIDGLKRHLRVGMGICQGRNCIRLIARAISIKTGQPVEYMVLPTNRVPLRPIPYRFLACDINESEK